MQIMYFSLFDKDSHSLENLGTVLPSFSRRVGEEGKSKITHIIRCYCSRLTEERQK